MDASGRRLVGTMWRALIVGVRLPALFVCAGKAFPTPLLGAGGGFALVGDFTGRELARCRRSGRPCVVRSGIVYLDGEMLIQRVVGGLVRRLGGTNCVALIEGLWLSQHCLFVRGRFSPNPFSECTGILLWSANPLGVCLRAAADVGPGSRLAGHVGALPDVSLLAA